MTSPASSRTPSATGTVVVTGGTSGLGLETARVLAAEPGLRVVLTGRDGDRARSAATQLGPTAVGLALDLGSLASVRRFPTALDAAIEGEDLPPLRALVANAGLQFTHRAWTEDGFEATFGVNHLGHLALIDGLLDRFQTPARIVVVSSGTHDPAKRTGLPHPLPLDARALAHPAAAAPGGDSPARDGRRRYATSKLANVAMTYELARRLADREITVNAFDPGLMPGTGLSRDYGPVARALFATVGRALVVLPGANTPRTSGADLARLVTDPTLAKVTGDYFVRRLPARSSAASHDEAATRVFHDDSLALLAEAEAGVQT